MKQLISIICFYVIAAISKIDIVPKKLEIICRSTGKGLPWLLQVIGG